MYVAKTKALISFAVAASLFSHMQKMGFLITRLIDKRKPYKTVLSWIGGHSAILLIDLNTCIIFTHMIITTMTEVVDCLLVIIQYFSTKT